MKHENLICPDYVKLSKFFRNTTWKQDFWCRFFRILSCLIQFQHHKNELGRVTRMVGKLWILELLPCLWKGCAGRAFPILKAAGWPIHPKKLGKKMLEDNDKKLSD